MAVIMNGYSGSGYQQIGQYNASGTWSTVGYNNKSYWRIKCDNSSLAGYMKSFTFYGGMAGNNVTYTAGTSVTGDGKAGTVYATLKKGSGSSYTAYKSDTITISTTIGRLSGSSGYYPNYDQCTAYTFTWSTPVKMAAGEVWYIFLTFSSGKIFVIKRPNSYSNVTSLMYTSYVGPCTNLNGTWNQKSIPYVNINGTWKEGIMYVNVNGTWQMAGQWPGWSQSATVSTFTQMNI